MKSTTQIAFMLLLINSLILPFFIGYILISYIKSLENTKCACSSDIRRKYVKFYGYFLILFAVFTLVINLIFGKIGNKQIQNIFRVISFSINILAAYLIFSYSNILQDSTCDCSVSWRRTFMKFYGYFLSIIFSLVSFCLIMSFIYHISLGDDIIIQKIRA